MLISCVLPICTWAASISTEHIDFGGKILTQEISESVKNYVKQEYVGYLGMIQNSADNFGIDNTDYSNYYLGNAMKAYNKDVYYFPICCNEEVIGIIIVDSDGENYHTSFGRWFADELNALYSSGNDEFVLVVTEQSLIAAGQKSHRVLSTIGSYTESEQSVVTNIMKTVDESNMQEVNLEDVLYVQPSSVTLSDPEAPRESRVLSIPFILQGNGAICWAAACAMVINYVANPAQLETAQSISNRIVGDTDTAGWPWHISQAYADHNLNYYSDGPLNYSTVKMQINNNRPIHANFHKVGDVLTWHSVVIKGYEVFPSGSKHYFINDPNYSITYTLSAESSIVYYTTPLGTKYVWATSYFGFY